MPISQPFQWLRNSSRETETYATELLDLLSLLADNPQMARERAEITPPVRVHPFRAHLVIYTVRADRIVVLRLPRASREWQRLLQP
ncbi:type II toxin-antitoxin system RelE/ParE family toxin [Jiella sp. 40Bstr34]|uniref:Type II toxin-antitoxin system RelE/ParE family toxin n=2 Tax=Jiella pacifica TaxID=2696469 RepID=A0A6N9TGB2_9HYPH|nr:type II toxin-antitoxin system RelE/ParE family toxin [Jiella pacifica]